MVEHNEIYFPFMVLTEAPAEGIDGDVLSIWKVRCCNVDMVRYAPIPEFYFIGAKGG